MTGKDLKPGPLGRYLFLKKAIAESLDRQSRVKQREEEALDLKAERAQRYSEEFKRCREESLSMIEVCHREIDSSAEEIEYCGRKIDEYKTRIQNQERTINVRRQEAAFLRREAEVLRIQADSACLLGCAERGMHSVNKHSQHQELLERAAVKQLVAIRIDRESEDLERLISGGKENLRELYSSMVENGRIRREFEQKKLSEEKKVSELAEKLLTFKIEIASCKHLAVTLREEEAKLDAEAQRLAEESQQALKESIVAEHEAEKLEMEISNL